MAAAEPFVRIPERHIRASVCPVRLKGCVCVCGSLLCSFAHLLTRRRASDLAERALNAAGLGVRWGMGHSVGLLLMFGIFLILGSEVISDDGPVAFATHLVVGVFMLALGLMGCLRYHHA